jgi:hypothetical protein
MDEDSRVLPAERFEPVIGAARAGAAWALNALYRDLAPAVVGYPSLQGVEDPADLSCEVFLGVFRGLGGFSGGEGAFRSRGRPTGSRTFGWECFDGGDRVVVGEKGQVLVLLVGTASGGSGERVA